MRRGDQVGHTSQRLVFHTLTLAANSLLAATRRFTPARISPRCVPPHSHARPRVLRHLAARPDAPCALRRRATAPPMPMPSCTRTTVEGEKSKPRRKRKELKKKEIKNERKKIKREEKNSCTADKWVHCLDYNVWPREPTRQQNR
ncbi:hypothetical protein GUJ93_ZPchr0007g4475 [Zizania palustris]|uniref:Uncharacterized protein n=1 Tax=Zizania palustris TaxID=103762 RepID=A0A8J5T6P5_ZIZPA|nr:hypothetical protein GUJ93_ZPchr0007g4475 [Zizania palustris]